VRTVPIRLRPRGGPTRFRPGPPPAAAPSRWLRPPPACSRRSSQPSEAGTAFKLLSRLFEPLSHPSALDRPSPSYVEGPWSPSRPAVGAGLSLSGGASDSVVSSCRSVLRLGLRSPPETTEGDPSGRPRPAASYGKVSA
jgi:hypothetical protein